MADLRRHARSWWVRLDDLSDWWHAIGARAYAADRYLRRDLIRRLRKGRDGGIEVDDPRVFLREGKDFRRRDGHRVRERADRLVLWGTARHHLRVDARTLKPRDTAFFGLGYPPHEAVF